MSAPEHKHRYMRCKQEFDCHTPGLCRGNYWVLPTIVLLDGTVTEHCPPGPDYVPPPPKPLVGGTDC